MEIMLRENAVLSLFSEFGFEDTSSLILDEGDSIQVDVGFLEGTLGSVTPVPMTIELIFYDASKSFYVLYTCKLQYGKE